jgi:L-lactate permease
MHMDILSVLSLLSAAPFVLIAGILTWNQIRQLRCLRATRVGKRLFGVQASAVGLGMAFLFLQAFWRPSISHAIEVRQEVDAEDDDEGEPETVEKQLSRQLKRIRRGEVVERLVLRL